jgi:polar amino acid transport system substrate-binding protein
MLIFSLMAVPCSAREKIILATGEYIPYVTFSGSGKGFFCEIVTAAFRAVGIDVEYRDCPWKRCEMEVANGTVMGALPYAYTPERAEKYLFSDVVAASQGKLFYDKTRFPAGIPFNRYEDLRKYRIGGTMGYWYEKEFRNAGLTVDYAATDELNIKMLHLGRTDLFPIDELAGWYIIRKMLKGDAGRFATLDKPLYVGTLCVIFSRKNPYAAGIAERFNAGLALIKERGIYRKILEKHGIDHR